MADTTTDTQTTDTKKPTAASEAGLPPILVASSPQFHDRATTANIMWLVSACLLPASAWGVYVFGLGALWIQLASVLTAVLAEFLIGKLLGRFTLSDGSAVLTGLLVGMNMPPAVPIGIAVVATLFAIVVVKWTFGGLGTNWMNPALAGRVFVFFSWTGEMTRWVPPRTWEIADATTSATLLSHVKTGLLQSGPRPLSELMASYPTTAGDSVVTAWLNQHLFSPLGARLPEGYFDAFVGNIPGSIGEVSALLLLVGSIVLVGAGIVTWHIPTSYFASFAFLVWVFGGVRHGAGYFSGDVLFHVITGGFMLGLFYMSTDMVTSPMTSSGMLAFGAGVGFLTFLIRIFGSFPEGVSLAILVMNIFVPLINRATKPRIFGTGRPVKPKEVE